MEKLKPCPFCGGDATIQTYREHDGHETWQMWLVYCTTCYAEIKFHKEYFMGSEPTTEDEAIAAWNRRTNDEAD